MTNIPIDICYVFKTTTCLWFIVFCKSCSWGGTCKCSRLSTDRLLLILLSSIQIINHVITYTFLNVLLWFIQSFRRGPSSFNRDYKQTVRQRIRWTPLLYDLFASSLPSLIISLASAFVERGVSKMKIKNYLFTPCKGRGRMRLDAVTVMRTSSIVFLRCIF